MQNICIIINPISGMNRKPEKIVRCIEEVFNPHGIKYEIVYTEKPGDGTWFAKQAADSGKTMVVAAGGDGTINEIGRGLIQTEVTLGVIPAGSGNGFARNFNIPLNQRKAIELLLSPSDTYIDTGIINNHYFFNVAGIGLDAEISSSFEQFGVRGPLPYFILGTQAFFRFKPSPIKIITRTNEIECSPLLITIANAPQYGNGAVIAPSAVPDDGLLDVCILDKIPLWKTIPNIHRLFNGTIDQYEGFHSFRDKSIQIERKTKGVIQTDGNPHQEAANLNITVLPASLRVATGSNS